ncbi:hypothetical protein LBMAG42_20330 [Deltaproteobacteria bacterium]|nr:hypothetical protein LBMAG42_20330 [Deltaproteobacteria bacterium]
MILLAITAGWALELRVVATVEPDLRTIHGEVRVPPAPSPFDTGNAANLCAMPPSWRNPLHGLAPAAGDVAVRRTAPGWATIGTMLDAEGADVLFSREETLVFSTELPSRYGDTGALKAEGLWSNGTWLPLPDGGESAHEWQVDLHLPEHVVAVLNGTVFSATSAAASVHWQGRADRLSLAVLPERRAPVSTLDVAGGHVTFVGKAAQRPNVQKQVRALLEASWPWDEPPEIVVVTDHDRRRLATSGPGVVYLSDRAFRLSPGLSRFHWPAVRRALYAAAAPASMSSWEAVFFATLAAEGQPAPSVEKALGWAAWNPIIDELLTDGTLPFYDDTFNSAHPDAPDALLALGGRRDPRAAALQALDALGAEALLELRRAVRAGPHVESTLAQVAATLGLDPRVVATWGHAEDPGQDYRVELEGGLPVRVRREGGVAAEPVSIEVDGAVSTWMAPAAPASLALPGGARKVAVDPQARLFDADRANNRAPPRWNTVVTGWVDEISPSQSSFVAWGDILLRRQDDTRNLYLLAAQHTAQDLFSMDVGYVRYLGPLVNRRERTQRVFITAGPSLLDPAFRDTEAGAVVLGANAGYVYDSRTNDTYALSGRRLALGVGAGSLLGTTSAWASAGATWVELIPVHPRHVLATRLRAGWASGDVEHRLLPLGGADGVRAAGEREVLGNERVVANVEYRWAVVRDASLPLPLAWLSEIQVVPGIEAGASQRDQEASLSTAFGADLGLYATIDVFGARPTLFGAVLAFPIDTPAPLVPQVYFSFDHAF